MKHELTCPCPSNPAAIRVTGQEIGPFASRVAEFQHIVITPVSRGAPKLMPLRGGAQFPPGSPPWVHHCRGGKVFDDAAAIVDVAGRDRPLPGSFLYVGPSWPHFGHFVGEFMHRLWPFGMPQYEHATAMLVQVKGQQRPRYVDQLLDVLGVAKTVTVDAPVRVEHLIVGEPGKMLAAPPADEYLDYLDRKLEPLRAAAATAATPPRLAVLRPHIQKGRCLGEEWLEQELQADGYTVFRPEQHSIRDQMIHYLNASEIVFSEGSAIHLVDIMPRLRARVAVLARRHNSRIPSDSLSKKCSELHIYDDCLSFAPPYSNRGPGAMGISWVDTRQFLVFLRSHGFIRRLPTEDFFDDAGRVARDLATYVAFHLGRASETVSELGVMQESVALLAREFRQLHRAGR